MNNKLKKDIIQDKIIIEDITDGVHEYTYRVRQNTKLTIVLTGLKIHESKITLTVDLAGTGAKATIVGIFFGGISSDIRLHTKQTHLAPLTTSNLLVKSVLSDNASFHYDGSIRIEKAAQKTDAYQRNENLLIGEGSHTISKPTLEILANDVRCTHGSTTGPIDPEELWYLNSRGISGKSAKKLIVEGYFSKAVNLIEDSQIKSDLWQKIRSKL
jgi:Fe-S cluster assembly protein SufD